MEQKRAPVVTILGHVDHGKTTLLDYIRKTSVALGEHGGITQAIGAYQASGITFIDTPGHAAFEKMRSRGAQLADIAVLVVAADDGVMPQTIEAIKHIKAANIPMLVAVNKIDLPGINLTAQMEKVKRQLADQQVLVEEYGGDVPIVQISAKTGQGIENFLETLNLLSDIHEFKGDDSVAASGVIIEARLDKFRGPVATVLVRNGTLSIGEPIRAGKAFGKVRGMFDFKGASVKKALPSMPVEVIGFENVPEVGAKLGEGVAEGAKEKVGAQFAGLLDKLQQEQTQTLSLVIKADNQGSLEAIDDILAKNNLDKQHVKIVGEGTGNIVDADIKLAQATKGIVIGFNVAVLSSARELADTEHILIRNYKVIYELADEISEVVEGMLVPGRVEEVFGRAQILAEFPYGKQRIAGCQVLEGVFSKGPKVRIRRGEMLLGEGKIKSLKKGKEEVAKVDKGQECGMIFDMAVDFKVGDIVESFRTF